MIPVLRPTIDNKTKKELLKVLESGWWGQGPKTFQFEKEFADYVGAKYAIGCNSATSALDLCLKAYNIHDGELITTPFTFVSDAWAGEVNGMDVTFADIDPETLCLDPEAIKLTAQTKAIIAVDSHGRLADIQKIREKVTQTEPFSGVSIAPLIIEDAAHAMYTPGAGKYADITVWSFQAVKSMPTGDGGMITTNDEAIYKKLRDLSWLGVAKSTYERTIKKYSWDYDIKHSGIKAYMNDLTAVIGLGQLARLEQTNARRREIQSRYNEAFFDNENIELFPDSYTCQYYTQKFQDRNLLSGYLYEKGVATSVHFKPLSEMTYWKKAVKNPLPVTDKIWKEILTLPCHNALTDKEQKMIIDAVLTFYSYK